MDKITKTKLKERGWTESLIKKFIPVPCDEKINIAYGGNSPTVKLYTKSKIYDIERTDILPKLKHLGFSNKNK